MINKIKKYYNYIERFAKSPRKGKNIRQLFSEIRGKGLVTGIRSILHIKSGNYNPEDEADFIYNSNKQLAKVYDRATKVVLPDSKHPKVSIIIPIYNQLDLTFDCLMSIYEHNSLIDYEIIIADDNSTEDSSQLKEHFKNIIIVKNSENLGFVKNCNNASAKARGEYVVFLNNDTQVLENWLNELLYIFETNPLAGLVGSKLIYPNGQLQEAGGIIWQDGSALNYGNRRNPDSPEFNYVKEVDYISGASIMIDIRLWKKLGGFDENFSPAYNEDTDFCFQVRAAGYKVIYQPFSRVVHFEGKSHGTDVRKGVKRYQVINKEKFAKKWQHELRQKSKNGENIFFERDRSKGKKHVLIIDHNVPTIDKDAGSRSINSFIDALLDMNCSVQFLVPNMYPLKKYTKLLQLNGVEVLHGDRFVYWHHEWENYLKQNMNYIDAILLSRSSIATPHLKYLVNHHYKGKTIYYGHDLGFLRTEQEAILYQDPELVKTATKLKESEDFMYKNADHSLVISSDELEYLQKYIKKPLHAMPLLCYEVIHNYKTFTERNGILFVGGFHHPPNQGAIKWFLDEMYPSLYAENIKLTVAGSEMPEFVVKYKEKFPSIEILPDVSNEKLEDLYSNTRIAIVPLEVGAGVKGKVIEAMSKGVPIVGTDRAFEGLYKDDYFLYKGMNTPAEFIETVRNVYSDPELWSKLSTFGQNYVEQNFNKEKIKQVFKNILDS